MKKNSNFWFEARFKRKINFQILAKNRPISYYLKTHKNVSSFLKQWDHFSIILHVTASHCALEWLLNNTKLILMLVLYSLGTFQHLQCIVFSPSICAWSKSRMYYCYLSILPVKMMMCCGCLSSPVLEISLTSDKTHKFWSYSHPQLYSHAYSQ